MKTNHFDNVGAGRNAIQFIIHHSCSANLFPLALSKSRIENGFLMKLCVAAVSDDDAKL